MRSTAAKKPDTWDEADAAFLEIAPGHDLRLKCAVLAEEQMFPARRSFARAAPDTPTRWGSHETCRVRRDFRILSPQKISCSWILRAERLRLHAASPLPYKRAGKTRVLLNTIRSSGSQQAGKGSELCIAHPLQRRGFTCSSRDAARSDRGPCAMSSSGNE